LIIAAIAAVSITHVCNLSLEMFGHNEKVVSIENFNAMKIFIAHHLLELMVAEFSHRCEKLSK
jgi:signal recognition particle GTPase